MKKRKGELPSGSIRKQVYIGTVDGKRKYRSVTGSTYAEVESKAILLKAELKRIPADADILFRHARERYLEKNEPVLSPTTIRGYHSLRFTYKDIDDLPLTNITNDVLQDWVNSLLPLYARKTVSNSYGLAKKILSEYHIDSSAKLPKKEQNVIFVPSNEQVQTMLQYFRDVKDKDMEIAVSLAAFGTLRRGEICGLTANDIRGNVVHVHNTIVMDKSNNIRLKTTTKTAQSDRYIELPQFVIDLLPKQGKIVNLKPNVITHRWEKGLLRAGLPHFKFHSLRAYAASFMHSIGIPDFAIMERGGWSCQDTLNRIYRGTVPEYKQTFIDRTNSEIERLFS